jgi:hypothetical protein
MEPELGTRFREAISSLAKNNQIQESDVLYFEYDFLAKSKQKVDVAQV